MKSGLLILCVIALFAAGNTRAQSNPPMKLIDAIPLPSVEGYFDHPAVDVKGQRLFLPGENQRTIEVIDLRAGKVIRTITGFGGDPRKTIYLPEVNQIWVDDGDSTLKCFSGENYELLKTVNLTGYELDKDSRRVPDNGVYDPATHLFYLGDRADSTPNGGPKGSIEIVDVKSGTLAGSIEVEGKNPAGLALDPAWSKLYVVMGDTSKVVVIDLKKRTAIATWPITGGPEPHAVAIDGPNRRLFIGSRVKPGHIYKPGKLVIMDADNGKVIDAIDTEGGVDEVEWEPKTGRIYYTGTTGFIEVFKQVDKDHYQSIGKAPTGAIAKTSLLVTELNRFYSAVPKHIILTPPVPQAKEATIEDAHINVYEILP